MSAGAAGGMALAAEYRARLGRRLATLAVPPRTAALLAGLPPGPGPLDAACAGARGALFRVVDALAEGTTDGRAYREAVATLSGLGPGLTPTGDDLLVAVLVTGRRLVSAGLLAAGSLSRLAAAVAASPPGRTTPRAAHLLREACDGRASAPLDDLLEALGDERVADRELADRCARLVATGAHSGADWLAGVLALATRCSKPPRDTPSAGDRTHRSHAETTSEPLHD